MSGVLRSEIRKITTTRLWWILLICVFLLGGGYARCRPSSRSEHARVRPALDVHRPRHVLQHLQRWQQLRSGLAVVIGIAAVGSEQRHHTLASTYLATPHRLRLLLGQGGVLLIFGLIYGAASVAAGVVVAIPFVLAHDGSLFLSEADTWRSLVLGVAVDRPVDHDGHGHRAPDQEHAGRHAWSGSASPSLIEPVLAVWFFLKAWDLALNLMPTGATNAMLGTTSWILFGSTDPWPGGKVCWCSPDGACCRRSSVCCRRSE